jgi:hypothetical protein
MLITKQEFEKAANEIRNNIYSALPQMISYKTTIQQDVLAIATQCEMFDVAACRINDSLIEKLVMLANKEWRKDRSGKSLYCAAMAVATIIKEYDWGVYYLTGEGLYELANQIQNK